MAALAEFRWILLGLGLLLIAGIWWWGARRSRHLPGRSALREPTIGAADNLPVRESPPMFESFAAESESRDWGVPPFEPLSIRTAEFEQVPVMDQPVITIADLQEPAPVPRETQRIVTIRIVADGEAGWPGAALLAGLERQGFAHGRYQVFHYKQSDGQTLFCAASLVEPGTFDLERMPGEHYRGLTLFAVLPGPVEPAQVLDLLFATAHDLATRLQGEVQDAKGHPLTPQRAEELREDVTRFQALLT